MIQFVLVSLAVLVAVVAFVRVAYPQTLARLLVLTMRRALGFRSNSIDAQGIAFPYLESGPASGEVLLLLHGFSGDKDNWPLYAFRLRWRYRVIIPDLPGFGDSAKDPAADYGIAAQVERVRGFLEALGIGRLHIGGNSMGGFIALQFALTYPERVSTLTLLNSAGVTGKNKSDLERAVERDESPLTVSTEEEFVELMDFVMFRRMPLPVVVRRMICEQAIANRPLWDKIFIGLRDAMIDSPLNSQLHNVEAPTLVIWGRHDRVIDVSCCDVFQEGIPDCRCVIFEDAGHVPMLEHPFKSAAVHLEHLQKHPATS